MGVGKCARNTGQESTGCQAKLGSPCVPSPPGSVTRQVVCFAPGGVWQERWAVRKYAHGTSSEVLSSVWHQEGDTCWLCGGQGLAGGDLEPSNAASHPHSSWLPNTVSYQIHLATRRLISFQSSHLLHWRIHSPPTIATLSPKNSEFWPDFAHTAFVPPSFTLQMFCRLSKNTLICAGEEAGRQVGMGG